MPVERDRLVLGPPAAGLVAGPDEELGSARSLAGLAPVMTQRRDHLPGVAGRLFEEARHGGVTLAPERSRQRRVRDLADELMLEGVLDVSLEP